MTEQQTPPSEAGFFATIRGWGLTRSDERVFSGVAGGIAERLGWSRAWTRVGLVGAAIILNGLVLLAYAAAWALLPDRQGRIVAQNFGRGVPNVSALIGIGVIALAGLITLGDGPFDLLPGSPPWEWGGWFGNGIVGGMPGEIVRVVVIMLAILIPLVLIGGAIFLAIYLSRRNRNAGAADAEPRTGAPEGGPAPVYAAPPVWAEEKRRARTAAAQQAQDSVAQAHATVAEATQSAREAIDESMAEVRSATDQAAHAWQAEPHPSWQAQHQPWQAHPAPASSPQAAPAPRKPRVPGPGGGFWLLTLAWAVIAGAGVAWAEWDGRLAVHPVLGWFALFVTGFGVIIALIALSGRKLGFLGFASVVACIPALLFIVEADDIRDGWAQEWIPDVHVVRDGDQVTSIEIGDHEVTVGDQTAEPDTDIDSVDAIAALEDDYSLIMMPGSCTSDVPTDLGGTSRGLIAPGEFTGDRTVEATAEVTTVRVIEGTGFAIDLADDEWIQLILPDRGFSCDVEWGTEVGALTPGEPLLEIDPTPAVTTIVIEEVAP